MIWTPTELLPAGQRLAVGGEKLSLRESFMSAGRQRAFSNDGFGLEPIRHWLNSQLKRKLLLRKNPDPAQPMASAASAAKPAVQQASRLEQCCENVLDAHTVEGAIFWHCEIISELSATIVKIRDAAGDRPEAVRMIAALDERQRYHYGAVNRLTGILQRNENFVWQP